MSTNHTSGVTPEGTVTLDETCRILGVSAATLHRWEADGSVTLWKSPLINKRVRYRRDEVEALAAQINVDTEAGEAMDTAAVAAFLDLPEQTVRRLEHRGLLVPARTIGNHRRYAAKAVADFKASAEYVRIRNRRQGSRTNSSTPSASDDAAPAGFVYAEQAAEILGVQRPTLRKWEREGRLVAWPERHNKRVMYDRETIMMFKKGRSR